MDFEVLIGGFRPSRKLKKNNSWPGKTENERKNIKMSENQAVVPTINVEKTSGGLDRKTYMDLPNEVIYLALNCDLRSRAEACVNAKNINSVVSFVNSTQNGLDKVSQLIISLDEMAANENGLINDEDETLDEIEALQNAFHGEPEIEATATVTELIHLEPAYSEDPHPTVLETEQIPRRASSPYNEGVPQMDSETKKSVSPITNQGPSNSPEKNGASGVAPNHQENEEFCSGAVPELGQGDAVQSSSDPNQDVKSGISKNSQLSQEERPSGENLKTAEDNSAQGGEFQGIESMENPAQRETSQEANSVSEEDFLKYTSETVIDQSIQRENRGEHEQSFENEKPEGFGDVSLNLEEGDNVKDSPKPDTVGRSGSELLSPRTSSVRKRSRKNASSLASYYQSAVLPYQKKVSYEPTSHIRRDTFVC